MWWLYVLLALAAILLLLIVIVLIRTATFRPKAQPAVDNETVLLDNEKIISALGELIKCKTVSFHDGSLEDDNEFEKLINLLPSLYPAVFDKCTFKKLPDRGLLFHWQGERHDAPSVMMAHYDVVPVEEENWEKAPFEAIIENGVMWGRGTLDTKVTFNGVLSAANELIEKGFVPKNDIYFAFSGNEEVNGNGAVNIVNYFLENGIKPALVVDEGGAVVEGVFPGVSKPCGLIGIAEKGMMNLTFSTESQGGHASAPAPHTPVGILSKACCDVENSPFPFRITKPAAEMFDTLGRHSNFLYRMIFANLWLFKGVLNMICKKSGGEINALLRTTVAFTQADGSLAPNVIPPSASMTANIRLNPLDSIEGAVSRIKDTISNEKITLTVNNGMEPSPISETYCEAWDKVASAVASTWKGCLVAPYLMVQCSDSRHYRNLSNHVYRFSAMALTTEERRTIHGNNERIKLENIVKAAEYYVRLMKQC